jgi:oxygen-dependent protoporphyrinogen oxidase
MGQGMRVAVIGGGITGLSAAYYLKRMAREQGLDLDLRVLERDERIGGKIRTDRVGSYVIEAGPDAFLTQKPWAVELARDLGLGDELIPISSARPATSVLVRGKPRPLPEGLALIVPTKLWPFLRSPILSLPQKLRALGDLVQPARGVSGDESVASFVRARMGAGVLDRLAEPLMVGIHSGTAGQQSLLATFPQFRLAEERAGSVIRGITRQHRQQPTSTSPVFCTFRDGTGALVAALARALDGHIHLGQGVAQIALSEHGYRIVLDHGETSEADAAILTTPASVAAGLIERWDPEQAERLRALRSVSTGTLSLVYGTEDITRPFAGYGLVIPPSEGRFINAITVTSSKFAHRAPSGHVVLRVFFGGARHPYVVEWSDQRLLELARRELRDLMGISAPPRIARLWRWHDASPQYDVGHLERIDAIEQHCPPGLILAGCAYRGVGIPDCVRQGRQAAERTLALAQDPRRLKARLG